MINANTDPFIGLCEMQNIVTIVAEGWDAKIVAAQDQITTFLQQTDQQIVAIAKDPVAAKKVARVFDSPQVVVANMKNNIAPLQDLSNTYAIVIVDSALFSDYSKYLLSLQAADNACRLVMVL